MLKNFANPEVLRRVARPVELVADGRAKKAENSLELLYIIDPDLRRDEEGQKVSDIMHQIRSNLLI